ncbi:hypothetical protein NDU88_002270 [Pleurodeles waltl]|uniref:Uncharacterized protein n=1 Tax=Pleurodeles waltl TaxID=8319 RepID=A0AAV7M5I6_PLEWA|nr:hypothetical protein NDU88_002270 [Pleurodeles waltl]
MDAVVEVELETQAGRGEAAVDIVPKPGLKSYTNDTAGGPKTQFNSGGHQKSILPCFSKSVAYPGMQSPPLETSQGE